MFGYSSIAALFGLPLSQDAQVQKAAPSRAGGGGCDSGHERVGSSNASNPIMQALAQALESLGLTLSGAGTDAGSGNSAGGSQNSSAAGTSGDSGAAAAGASSANNAASAGTSAAAAASASSSASVASSASAAGVATRPADDDAPHRLTYHSIARDIRHLMHALFQDIRAENLLSPAGTSSSAAASDGTGDGAPSAVATSTTVSATSPFAAGLAALISQVSSGSVPANLQRAFNRLVADLQRLGGAAATSAAPASSGTDSAPSASGTTAPGSSATGSAASGTGATSDTSAATSAQSLLLKFLTTLQQDLGYGPAASSASTTNGLIVNQVA